MSNPKAEVKANKIVVWTKDEIKKDQDGIAKTLTALDASVHMNAVQCMIHAEKHGDTSLMTRLLVDVLDGTGYRRAGMINWMRKHSPMELVGKVIKLNGVDDNGKRREFKIEEAHANPFWTDRDNDERVAKPVYADTFLSPITNAIKNARAAIKNTVDGKPIDATKPFFDGIHTDKLEAFLDAVEAQANVLPADNTRAVRKAQKELAMALEEGK